MDYGIAIDIGTTTLGAVLVALDEGRVLREASRLNSGRMFGADVISRIQASNDGSQMMLQDLMRSDLTALLKELVSADVSSYIKYIAIAGNTTMLHLLRGYSCAGLGTFPYTAVTLSSECLKAKDVLPNAVFLSDETKVLLFPGFTAFVGADVAAGVYSLTGTGESRFLLLDLGTNGEMALVEQSKLSARRIRVCSTAAGPVFEGGGISCGMGGVKGAIAHVRIDDACAIDVIGDGAPLGLCGTGVLETVSELRKTGILDETGLMKEPYFKLGFSLVRAEDSGTDSRIAFTQDDVRAVQMAKAAIRAGIETLLTSATLKPEEIDAVYVAGGYGQHMDFQAIRALQMIPDALIDKCVAAGNTSLQGCIHLLHALSLSEKETPDALFKTMAALDDLTQDAIEVVLAQQEGFEALYYESMGL